MDLENKSMRMALLVIDSSPAVKKRIGNTRSQTGETLSASPQRATALNFTREDVDQRNQHDA